MRDGVAQAVAHSVGTVFLIATPIAALGFLVVLFLKEYPLRTWSQDGGGRCLINTHGTDGYYIRLAKVTWYDSTGQAASLQGHRYPTG